MSGNRTGGIKAREKNLAKDPNFYSTIGKSGGLRTGVAKGFASEKVGINDGLTGRMRASLVGSAGGKKSRIGKHEQPTKD